jgi:hypothetical protein
MALAAALSGAPALAEPVGASGNGVSCALPVVLRAGVRDVHESPFNGPEGFAFVAEAGAEKTGELPARVGRDPVRTFDLDVYASNFQGPVLVRHPGLRPQWEWTADGSLQVSDRSYPLVAAHACAAGASALPARTLHVDEHDEPPWRSDAVGAFTVELGACDAVLAAGRRSGWTAAQRSEGLPYDGDRGPQDVVFVEYVTWCYRCDGARDCRDGIE